MRTRIRNAPRRGHPFPGSDRASGRASDRRLRWVGCRWVRCRSSPDPAAGGYGTSLARVASPMMTSPTISVAAMATTGRLPRRHGRDDRRAGERGRGGTGGQHRPRAEAGSEQAVRRVIRPAAHRTGAAPDARDDDERDIAGLHDDRDRQGQGDEPRRCRAFAIRASWSTISPAPARAVPSIRLPQSPMNTRAEGWFQTRKPRVAPAIASGTTSGTDGQPRRRRPIPADRQRRRPSTGWRRGRRRCRRGW